jgi:hypothetical protein
MGFQSAFSELVSYFKETGKEFKNTYKQS